MVQDNEKLFFFFKLQTKIRVNYGKDFTLDTMEINAWSDPSTYMAFSTFQYDQYRFGANRARDANIFFTEYAVRASSILDTSATSGLGRASSLTFMCVCRAFR